MARPNLFTYATSELSQDAFLCWFLEWADSKYETEDKILHVLAKDFVSMLINSVDSEHSEEPNDVDFTSESLRVEIKRQYENIDIFCIVNGKYKIIIEDKVGTKNHSNQLNRYLESVLEKSDKNYEIIPVYIQTGDQSDYSSVYESSFSVITRHDLLGLMSKYISEIKNDIITDFYNTLKTKENMVKGFDNEPVSEWRGNSIYQGFFTELSKQLDGAKWDYVPNASGGFYGIWWHFRKTKFDKCDIYLQANSNLSKLLIKINTVDKNTTERRNLRNKFSYAVINNKNNIEIVKPERFGNGTYMTVAMVKQNFPVTNENGLLDMDETVKLIKLVEKLVDNVANEVN